jgi:hypothetical protein
MRSLAKAFALVLGMLLVSSMLSAGTTQQALAQSAGKTKPTLKEAIVNGGFELGDLTGWTVNPGNGSVAVVTTNPYAGNYCAYISGLKSLYQGFTGIPTSSIQSITYCKRTEPESTTLALQLCYSDNSWDEIWDYINSSWNFFDVTSNLKTNKILTGIQLPGWNNASGAPMNTYYDDVSILYSPSPPPTPVGVKVDIYPGSSSVQYVNSSNYFYVNHGSAVDGWSNLTADVQSAFLDLQQNNFTLQTSAPNFQNPSLTHYTDYNNETDEMRSLFFFQFHPDDLAPGTYSFVGTWSSTALANPPNYTASYLQNTITLVVVSVLPYNVTILSRCNTEDADVNVTIFMDGSSTGLDTPQIFAGLNGSHTFAVLAADSAGHLFSRWSTGQTSTTITVSENGTYTAYYGAPALSGNVTRVPQDYMSIQAAVDAAPSGSTIVICPGVYNESIIVNKPLTIIGRLGSEPIFRGGGSGIAITLLQGASGSIISGIIITSWDEGIHINGASGCKIYDNIMSQISNCGIAVHGSGTLDNLICSNVFEDTTVAVDLTTASYNNTVYRNIISTNAQGILLGPNKNIVCANTIISNSIALNLTSSGNNLVFHNNFVNNTVQVSVSASAGNTWDNGYPSGGNYWSNHTGLDLYSGPNQDQLGSDGILDTGYTVAGGGVDRYPLSEPFSAHDVGITDFAVAKTAIGGGHTLLMEVKILNYGLYDENFLVTVYTNTSAAAWQSVALAKCNYTVVALTWNTTGSAYGNCTLRVCAGPVAGETNTGDNTFTSGSVYVGGLGDVNADGRVDMRDVSYVARRFLCLPRDPWWDANADINGDGKVDMIDIGTVARHFGEHYP